MNWQTDSSDELDRIIVEFERWGNENRSDDLLVFARQRELSPSVIEHLQQFRQLDKKFASRDQSFATVTIEPSKGLEKQLIGNFELVSKLGSGGMGTVWLAQQTHPISRKVAIKLIRSDRGAGVTLRRFEREKQALALLSHPNVAQVYDAGISEDGRPYIAMEYVDGLAITEFCQTQNLSLNLRLELFLQLCSAIEHAHQNGFLHRDIKPENILVAKIDGRPIVKVIDFGLVRPSRSRDPQITDSGMIVGTPLWMSPEQVCGAKDDNSKNRIAGTIDTRADVYSLGVILYQLLTDKTPISEDYYQRATQLELLTAIQNDVPVLPSTRVVKENLRSVEKSTPVASWANVLRNELDWVTMHALEKDRERRYPTVTAFADDVRNYLNNEPVIARPPSFIYKLNKLAQRHRLGAIAIGIIVGLVVFSSVAFATLWMKSLESERFADQARQRAVESEQIAKQAEAKSKLAAESAIAAAAIANQSDRLKSKAMQLTSEIIGNFNPTANLASLTDTQLQTLNKLRSEIDQWDFSGQAKSEAEFRMFLANLYSGAAEYESAVAEYERVVAILDALPEAFPRLLITAKLKLAEEHAFHGSLLRANNISKECVEQAKNVLGERDELTIRARANYAGSLFPLGGDDAFDAEVSEIVNLSRDELGGAHPVTINAMTVMAKVHFMRRRFVESATLANEALTLANETYGPSDLRTMELKALVLQLENRIKPTRELEIKMHELISEANEKFGPDHLFTLRIRQQEANSMVQQNFESARGIFVNLIGKCTKRYGARHLRTCLLRNDLGYACYMRSFMTKGDERKQLLLASCKSLTSILSVYEEMGLSESNPAIKAMTDLATTKLSMRWIEGSAKESLIWVEKALPLSEEKLGFHSTTTQILLDTKRKCKFELGYEEEAVSIGIEAFQRSLREIEQPSNTTASIASSVGDMLTLLKNQKAAVKYYALAYDTCRQLQGEHSRKTLQFRNSLLTAQAAIKDYESAMKNARGLIENLPPVKTSPGSAVYLRSAQVTIGEALLSQQKYEEARNMLEIAAKPAEGLARLFELRAKGALAICWAKCGQRAKAASALAEVSAELNRMAPAIPPYYRWFVQQAEQQLAELNQEQIDFAEN